MSQTIPFPVNLILLASLDLHSDRTTVDFNQVLLVHSESSRDDIPICSSCTQLDNQIENHQLEVLIELPNYSESVQVVGTPQIFRRRHDLSFSNSEFNRNRLQAPKAHPAATMLNVIARIIHLLPSCIDGQPPT